MRRGNTAPADDPPPDDPSGAPPPAGVFLDLWNSTPPLPRLDRLPPSFRRNLAERWRDADFRELWGPAVAALAESDFFLGRTKEGFVATLGWVVSERGWDATFQHYQRRQLRAAADDQPVVRLTAAVMAERLAEAEPAWTPGPAGGLA